MDEQVMIHKANEIARFFAAYPEDEAVAGVEDHLKRFWVPRMRRQVIDYVVTTGGTGLHAYAIEAVRRLETPSVPA